METWEAGEPAQLAAAVAQWFSQVHGRDPVGVFAAPGRVNLIGEHVDYQGGLCLPIALPHATYVALAPRDDRNVSVRSRQESEPFEGSLDALDEIDGWPAYSAGVLWAIEAAGRSLPGLDLVLDSTVPVGAGLSSSAAVECAVGLGAVTIAGGTVDDETRAELVRACMRAESELAGAPTGGLDQTIAMFGRADSALLLDCRDWTRRQIRWDPMAAGLTLLVIDTRASHSLSDGGYGSRVVDCEEACRQLGVGLLREVDDLDGALAALDDERLRKRVRHVVSEIARVRSAAERLEADDVTGLGELMTASHASLRDDYEVSCVELDVVVDTALAHGALGARMTGGGFGGSAIALVPDDLTDRVADAVGSAFADRGWREPGLLSAVPSAGAHRLS